MKGNTAVKRAIGIILMALLFPLLGGFLKADQGYTFMEGFWIGAMFDGIILAFVFLIVWLFGGFE